MDLKVPLLGWQQRSGISNPEPNFNLSALDANQVAAGQQYPKVLTSITTRSRQIDLKKRK
jgi:hypothetical protein